MSSSESHRAAARLMLEAESVLICPHIDPDGDAVGSLLGLTLALLKAGVTTTPTLADSPHVPPRYRFLPGRELLQAPQTLQPPPLFVALDSPSADRLGAARPLAEKAGKLIVIDHHPDCEDFGDITIKDPAASATGELIYGLLPHLGVQIDPDIATCLYTALVTDTGRFQYDNTSPRALRVAADLLEAGADAQQVRLQAFESVSSGMLDLTARVLSRMRKENRGLVAWSWYALKDLQETGVSPFDTENLIDSIRVVDGIAAAFLVKCAEDDCKVSLRSKTGADVGSVARSLGGGGHLAAAGYTSGAPLDATVSGLLPLLPGGRDAAAGGQDVQDA